MIEALPNSYCSPICVKSSFPLLLSKVEISQLDVGPSALIGHGLLCQKAESFSIASSRTRYPILGGHFATEIAEVSLCPGILQRCNLRLLKAQGFLITGHGVHQVIYVFQDISI